MRHLTRGLLVAALLVHAACSSIAHMRELREIQDDFSKLAKEENTSAIAAAAPTIDTLAAHAKARTGTAMLRGSAVNPEKYYREYFEIGQRLTALEKRAGQQLKTDGLLGTCQTLHVLADWRATFYGHYLKHGGSAAPIPISPAPKAMSNVWLEAQATAKRIQDNQWKVYPRDEYLLRAMEPLVMHDIVYLNAIKSNPTTTAAAIPLIEEFAKAEQKLAGLNMPSHIERYAVLSRYIMLRNAFVLFNHVGLDPTTVTSSGVVGLNTFKARVNQFRAEFRATVNGKNHQALVDIGINLTAAGGNQLDFFTGGGLPDVR